MLPGSNIAALRSCALAATTVIISMAAAIDESLNGLAHSIFMTFSLLLAGRSSGAVFGGRSCWLSGPPRDDGDGATTVRSLVLCSTRNEKIGASDRGRDHATHKRARMPGRIDV